MFLPEKHRCLHSLLIFIRFLTILLRNQFMEIDDEPKKYQITFKSNGELILIADCNRGGGKCEVKGNKLRISSTFLTLMSCGENSLDSRFTQHLEGNNKYRIADGSLLVEDVNGKTSMKFVRGRY